MNKIKQFSLTSLLVSILLVNSFILIDSDKVIAKMNEGRADCYSAHAFSTYYIITICNPCKLWNGIGIGPTSKCRPRHNK